MLVFSIGDVVDCSVNVVENSLNLLLCILYKRLSLLDSLLLVALSSQLVMTKS